MACVPLARGKKRARDDSAEQTARLSELVSARVPLNQILVAMAEKSGRSRSAIAKDAELGNKKSITTTVGKQITEGLARQPDQQLLIWPMETFSLHPPACPTITLFRGGALQL